MLCPFTKIKKLEKEVERLHGVITKQLTEDITLEDLSGNKNGLNMTLSGSPMRLFANAFGKQFIESGATNFLIMTFDHTDSGDVFEVTMQKVSGESVCDQLNRLRGEMGEIIEATLNPTVIDFVRCGIGANYSGEYHQNKLAEVHQPMLDLYQKYKPTQKQTEK